MAHYTNSVTLDEDVYDEMRLWRKGLVAMWNSEDHDCVFIEMVRDPTSQKHMSIECIPLPREVGDTAPIYFKKAIMESESEWSDNKKLIDLSKFRNGDIRKAIPKGFPYFSVDFGLQAGYAHVIEDVNAFPANFAQEIVGGMLDLHHRHWRSTQPMSFEEVKKKRDAMREKWKPFDWTGIAKKATKASEAHDDE
ncbi:CWF19L2 protein [Aphelenchoides avenae]|nr:CWF19L2 protein [Aphelenchus avenae]